MTDEWVLAFRRFEEDVQILTYALEQFGEAYAKAERDAARRKVLWSKYRAKTRRRNRRRN